ncbi:MAG: 3-phenylpropionate MFS transporter [Rhodospirillales bacterium CG15_BIG_FIL_POST_REV_8_21_14_020_66_15]|nr:MAG: 3-phenylpropionate MFS transporter [Rhodospirillales bacterium CG15_BIG_FIL_POST_REV_8_21_14_020_66_15]
MTPDAMTGHAPRLAPLRLALFYGGIFLALGIMGPFWPLWLKDKGLAAEEIGLIFALGTLARLAVTPHFARAADRTGERKRILVLLSLFGALAFLAFRWTEGFWSIALVTLLFFACRGPVLPLMESLTMLTRERVPFDYGRVRLWGSITFIIGAWGMGLVLTGAPTDWIHWSILAAATLAFLSALALPDTRTPAADGDSRPFRDLMRRPGLLAAMTAATCIQASHAVYYNFGSIHWLAAGHGADVIGALWAEGVIAEIILFTFAAAAVRRIGAFNMIVVGAAAALVRWAGTAATTDLEWLVLLQALHGLSFGATHLGIIHLIAERVEASLSASAQSLFAMTLGLGMSAASYAAGLLFAALGGGAFTAMSGLALAGAGFAGFSLLLRRTAAHKRPADAGSDRVFRKSK